MARVYPALEQALAAETPSGIEPGGGLFAQPAWHRAWARHAATADDRPSIVACGSSARLILPLTVRGLVARRVAAANNYFFSALEPVTFGATTEADFRDLAGGIASAAAGACEIDLHPLAPDSPLAAIAADSLRRRRWIVSDYFCFHNWFHRVTEADAESYLAARPPEVRSTLRRKAIVAARTEGWRLEVRTDSASLPQALAAYETVYRQSWKRIEPLQPFIRDVCEWAANAGKLRLGLAWAGEAPAAAQIWFVHAGVASIFKLAYDPAFGRLSPGSLLTEHLMRHVIDRDKVRRLDYLTGDEPYKRDWMSERREFRGLVAFNPLHPMGLARAARHFAGRLRRQGPPGRRRPGEEPAPDSIQGRDPIAAPSNLGSGLSRGDGC
jgi:hypothetical protein